METRAVTRKVLKVGQTALCVTLPREFIVNSGIQKGDTLAVIYDSRLIIVNPKVKDDTIVRQEP